MATRWRGAATWLRRLGPMILVGGLLLGALGVGSASRAPATVPRADTSLAASARRMARLGPCEASLCPIPRPDANELSVAGELGRSVAAVWLTPAGRGFYGRLELLDANMGPVADRVTIAASSSRAACGPGCWTFALAGAPATLELSALQDGHRYSLRLPIRWRQRKSALARRLLSHAVTSMRALAGVSVEEMLTSGPPGGVEKIHYRLGAGDRMAYSINTGGRVVIIEGSEWSCIPGHSWHSRTYGGGASGSFNTRNWYDWGQYDQSIQLLDERDSDGRLSADIALMSWKLPVWFRLRVDVASGHVSQVGMVAGGHFMRDVYSQYGVPQRIVSPAQ